MLLHGLDIKSCLSCLSLTCEVIIAITTTFPVFIVCTNTEFITSPSLDFDRFTVLLDRPDKIQIIRYCDGIMHKVACMTLAFNSFMQQTPYNDTIPRMTKVQPPFCCHIGFRCYHYRG